MNRQVQDIIEQKWNFINQYYIITDEAKPKVDSYFEDAVEMGEQYDDATAFYADFAAAGMETRFSELFMTLTPDMDALKKASSELPPFDPKAFSKKDILEMEVFSAKKAVERAAGTAARQAEYAAFHKLEEALGVDDMPYSPVEGGRQAMHEIIDKVKKKK